MKALLLSSLLGIVGALMAFAESNSGLILWYQQPAKSAMNEALPDGRLVVPNGWSPEHGPDEDGVSYNQQIVWDLFSNYMEAAKALGVDEEYRDKIAGRRDKLVGPQIGKNEGSFPGMLAQRTFEVGLVSATNPVGFSFRPTTDRTVRYRGKTIEVRL
jgi:Glycosyl hydrolase family 95 catalytic domain